MSGKQILVQPVHLLVVLLEFFTVAALLVRMCEYLGNRDDLKWVLTEGRARSLRLEMIIIDFGGHCLRNLCRKCWKDHDHTEWSNERSGAKYFNLYADSRDRNGWPCDVKQTILSGDLEKWDITALAHLITRVAKKCNTTPPYIKAVESLRDARNKLMHRHMTEISEVEFQRVVNELKQVLSEINRFLEESEEQVEDTILDIITAQNERVREAGLARDRKLQQWYHEARTIIENHRIKLASQRSSEISCLEESMRRRNSKSAIPMLELEKFDPVQSARNEEEFCSFCAQPLPYLQQEVVRPRIPNSVIVNLQSQVACEVSKIASSMDRSETDSLVSGESTRDGDSSDTDEMEGEPEEAVLVYSSLPSSESCSSMQVMEAYIMKQLHQDFSSILRESRDFRDCEDELAKLMKEFHIKDSSQYGGSSSDLKTDFRVEILTAIMETDTVSNEQKLQFWRLTARLAELEIDFLQKSIYVAKNGLFTNDGAVETTSHVTFLHMQKFSAWLLSLILRKYPQIRSSLAAQGISLVVFERSTFGAISMGASLAAPLSSLQLSLRLLRRIQLLSTATANMELRYKYICSNMTELIHKHEETLQALVLEMDRMQVRSDMIQNRFCEVSEGGEVPSQTGTTLTKVSLAYLTVAEQRSMKNLDDLQDSANFYQAEIMAGEIAPRRYANLGPYHTFQRL